MNRRINIALTTMVALGGCTVIVTEPRINEPQLEMAANAMPTEVFNKLIGQWAGVSRTWFEPDKLADESKITGEFTSVLDDRFVRHTYTGTIMGKSRRGEELLAYNGVTRMFESTWVDDFHMNYAIMFSQGNAIEAGFSVRGEYDVGENQPRWGWRTDYELIDADRLLITAWNIFPDGKEVRAIETSYRRVK